MQDSSESSESDLEDLSRQNQSYRPYRDESCRSVDEDVELEERDVEHSAGTGIMEPAMIRKKVKQSLARKQQKARRTKRGEAGVVTRQRRENKNAIKQSSGEIW